MARHRDLRVRQIMCDGMLAEHLGRSGAAADAKRKKDCAPAEPSLRYWEIGAPVDPAMLPATLPAILPSTGRLHAAAWASSDGVPVAGVTACGTTAARRARRIILRVAVGSITSLSHVWAGWARDEMSLARLIGIS